jgi:hypothetical protein
MDADEFERIKPRAVWQWNLKPELEHHVKSDADANTNGGRFP